MDDVAELKAQRTALIAEYRSLTADADSGRKGKVNYSADGQSVDWTRQRESLLKQIQQLTELIGMLEPFAIKSQVM